jgi:hypothetical protein
MSCVYHTATMSHDAEPARRPVPRLVHSPPTLAWVLDELALLADYRLAPVLFGGWSKELLGVWTAATHEDLDILVRAEDIAQLDAYIAARGADPFAPKRHAHKRAYLEGGRLVELFLMCPDGQGYVTDFYGRYRRVWPAPISRRVTVSGRCVEVASAETVIAYERDHWQVQEALYATHPELRGELRRIYGVEYAPCRHPFPTSPGAGAESRA